MTKQIIYDVRTGLIIEWQDLEVFGYAEPPPTARLLSVTSEQWARQDSLRWVVSGALTSVEPAAPEPVIVPRTQEEIEALRLLAYAEPITGSDRYFAEAQRMQLMHESGWEVVLEKAISRYQAIQLEYPWPVSSD
ncbi:hypothetical protein ACIOZM_21345 [Pseudomonas sp. NPDC087346]|uniref:hypothetical protein n=1 Tax=Pseudomonas sp. NPDC087346 TaxID=3364438 RepID=UPI0038307C27